MFESILNSVILFVFHEELFYFEGRVVELDAA